MFKEVRIRHSVVLGETGTSVGKDSEREIRERGQFDVQRIRAKTQNV